MRRSLVLVAVVAAALGAVAAGRWPGAAEPEPLVRAIGTIAMTVSDAERAAATAELDKEREALRRATAAMKDAGDDARAAAKAMKDHRVIVETSSGQEARLVNNP